MQSAIPAPNQAHRDADKQHYDNVVALAKDMADGMFREMEKEASVRWADRNNQELAKRFDELQQQLLDNTARCDAQERQAIQDKHAWEAAVQQERGCAERLLREQQLKEREGFNNAAEAVQLREQLLRTELGHAH